jgi:hypothetical protein
LPRGESKLTTRVGAEDVADSFCIDADALDTGDEVAAVALEEDAVFGPVVVDVVRSPNTF